MNYRHAFHAGNFADCLKHAVLVWLLRALGRKPAPFSVLDTHAGIGRYDLEHGPATRTGEWRAGIARLLEDTPLELANYVNLVRELGLYPGSPLISRALLRAGDHLTCCELHPEDAQTLRGVFARDPQVQVHHRDGYEALRGLLPMATPRGLVLMDPPFEQPDEFDRLLAGLRLAHQRQRTAIVAAWYPIKGRAPVRAFHDALRAGGPRDTVNVELWLRAPTDAARLNGCGLTVVNPPFGFETQISDMLRALLSRLGTGEDGAGTEMMRLTAE